MQTQQAVIENHSNLMQKIPSGGGIGSFVTRFLGCWHKQMSRPFSNQGQAYRTCLDCGASRQFNVRSWEMTGKFYYARPAIG
jgi:hypothetical protein